MRKEYDFSKARRNPYAARLKRQVTIRLDEQTIEYFKRVHVAVARSHFADAGVSRTSAGPFEKTPSSR